MHDDLAWSYLGLATFFSILLDFLMELFPYSYSWILKLNLESFLVPDLKFR
jgi:hypothetical protein